MSFVRPLISSVTMERILWMTRRSVLSPLCSLGIVVGRRLELYGWFKQATVGDCDETNTKTGSWSSARYYLCSLHVAITGSRGLICV